MQGTRRTWHAPRPREGGGGTSAQANWRSCAGQPQYKHKFKSPCTCMHAAYLYPLPQCIASASLQRCANAPAPTDTCLGTCLHSSGRALPFRMDRRRQGSGAGSGATAGPPPPAGTGAKDAGMRAACMSYRTTCKWGPTGRPPHNASASPGLGRSLPLRSLDLDPPLATPNH